MALYALDTLTPDPNTKAYHPHLEHQNGDSSVLDARLDGDRRDVRRRAFSEKRGEAAASKTAPRKEKTAQKGTTGHQMPHVCVGQTTKDDYEDQHKDDERAHDLQLFK